MNFPNAPDNQAPNDYLTRVIFESNGNGWLEGGTFEGENEGWESIQLTTSAAGGTKKVIDWDYTVTFEIDTDSSAENQAENSTNPDYDLYRAADHATANEWPEVETDPYTYELDIPADEPVNGVDRRIYMRTLEDTTYLDEGYQYVLLRITDVEVDPVAEEEGVDVVPGDNLELRWLIRDAEQNYSADAPGNPTSAIVMSYLHSTPWMAGLDYNSSSHDSPGTSLTGLGRTQPSVKFVTEGLNAENAGDPSEDHAGIRFFTADSISSCSTTLPLNCGNVVGTQTLSLCEFDISFEIDDQSTATWGDDYRIFDYVTHAETTPSSGAFSSKVPYQTGTTKTDYGHGIRIEVYRNEDTPESDYEESIIHIIGATRLNSCTTSDEAEKGWSSSAIWIIEDNPTS
ncbi:MAG: hypothetical protein GY711_06285 [bacterium]|nr:hypothetical protein [bacterium]